MPRCLYFPVILPNTQNNPNITASQATIVAPTGV